MKASLTLLMLGTVCLLAACSTPKINPEPVEVVTPKPVTPAIRPDNSLFSGENPEMTMMKDGKKLSLVRIMDGAACKNPLEGVKGTFLVYADLSDIERIKRERGAKVFSEFEHKIQDFSETVLQQAVNDTNLDDNPFALGKDEARETLAKQLSASFKNAARDAIAKFEQETTLTINIAPFAPSLVFYQQGCEAAIDETVGSESEPPLKP
jgi:hypothetical protein